ncbi:hypothetical protein BX616_001772 [Lobosporangium transversale]|nr:hypothetical protein BX616_001772 [Lobosporangium transversale]
MVDDIKKSFAKQTIHGGDPNVRRGDMVQMNAWINKADLVYKGPNSADYDPDAYKSRNLGTSPEANPLQDLIAFMKDLEGFDPNTNPDPVGFWNNTRLDLDNVLRTLAANGGKWQIIPTDMDNTFGSGYPYSTVPAYQTYVDFTKNGPRPLVQKLILGSKPINALFEQTLKEIVSTAFKPEAIKLRAEAYHKMLQLDAQWDLSLVRKSPGLDRNLTIEDFNTNLYTKTKNMQAGVLGWVESVSNLVAAQLNFAIPPGLVDRVPPPPKKGTQGSPEDEEDDVIGEGQDGGSGNGNSAASGFFASSKYMLGQAAFAAVVALAMIL